MTELLKKLAEKLGLCTSYSYTCKGVKCKDVSDELLSFFIESLGYGAKSEAEVIKSLETLDKRRWQRALEAIYVVDTDNVEFDVVLSKSEASDDIVVSYAKEGK